MTGPFEQLDIDGLDESLACIDRVCAVPEPSAGEGVGEESTFDVAERDPGDGAERRG